MPYVVQPYWHKNITASDIGDINNLRRQLPRKGAAKPISYPELKIFLNENIFWIAREKSLVARKQERIVAMGSIAPNIEFTKSESFGYIRNIVTDEHHRGEKNEVAIRYLVDKRGKTRDAKCIKNQSLAEIIVSEMISFAKYYQYDHLELTSGPNCVAANKLYRRLGFIRISHAEISGTNRYHLNFHENSR